MAVLIPVAAIVLIVIVANLVDLQQDEKAHKRFAWATAALNTLLLAAGLAAAIAPSPVARQPGPGSGKSCRGRLGSD